MKRWLPIHRSERGETLLSVMLAAAIIAIVVATFIQSTSNFYENQIRFRAMNSFHELERLFREMVPRVTFAEFLSLIADDINCDDAGAAANLQAAWNDEPALNGQIFPRILRFSGQLPTYTGNLVHEDAKNRCFNNQTLGVGGTPGDDMENRHSLYYCVYFQTLSSSPEGSLFSPGPVFAEVTYSVRQLADNSLATCNTFRDVDDALTDDDFYAQFNYTFYWRKLFKDRYIYFKWDGFRTVPLGPT